MQLVACNKLHEIFQCTLMQLCCMQFCANIMAERHQVMLLSVLVAAIVKKRRQRQRKRRRKVWVKGWIGNRERFGAYHQLMQELTMDVSSYCNFLRMSASTFENLLSKVAPLITRRDTVMRQAIPAGERLALTLRFIATGKYHIHVHHQSMTCYLIHYR